MSVVPMMAAFYGLAFANIFLRSSMGVLAPELAAELSLGPAMLGVIASAYFVSYALMQIPAGLLLDRYGPWFTVNIMFLACVGGVWLFAASKTGPAMMVARLLMGMGCAGVFAAAFMVIGRFFEGRRFTSIGGTLNSFAMLGTLCATAPLAAGVVAFGWRPTFIAIAALIACLSILSILTVRDYPGQARPARRGPVETPGQLLSGLWSVLKTPGVIPLAGAGFALSAGNTILGIWGGPYLNDVHGLDEISRGKSLVFMALAGVGGHFVFGHAAIWFNTLKGLVVGGGLVITGVMATLALTPDPSLVMVTALFALLGLACSFPTILLAHARALVPEQSVGRGLTAVNTGIMAAIALMQIAVGAVVGLMSEPDSVTAPALAYRTAFGFIACMALISTLGYLRVKDCKPHG